MKIKASFIISYTALELCGAQFLQQHNRPCRYTPKNIMALYLTMKAPKQCQCSPIKNGLVTYGISRQWNIMKPPKIMVQMSLT